MTIEMRRTLARLPYEDKLRMVAELIEFSRAFKKRPTEVDQIIITEGGRSPLVHKKQGQGAA